MIHGGMRFLNSYNTLDIDFLFCKFNFQKVAFEISMNIFETNSKCNYRFCNNALFISPQFPPIHCGPSLLGLEVSGLVGGAENVALPLLLHGVQVEVEVAWPSSWRRRHPVVAAVVCRQLLLLLLL